MLLDPTTWLLQLRLCATLTVLLLPACRRASDFSQLYVVWRAGMGPATSPPASGTNKCRTWCLLMRFRSIL